MGPKPSKELTDTELNQPSKCKQTLNQLCVECNKPFYLFENNCIESCPSGYTQSSTPAECIKCYKTCKSCTGILKSQCTSCIDNFELNIIGNCVEAEINQDIDEHETVNEKYPQPKTESALEKAKIHDQLTELINSSNKHNFENLLLQCILIAITFLTILTITFKRGYIPFLLNKHNYSKIRDEII